MVVSLPSGRLGWVGVDLMVVEMTTLAALSAPLRLVESTVAMVTDDTCDGGGVLTTAASLAKGGATSVGSTTSATFTLPFIFELLS